MVHNYVDVENYYFFHSWRLEQYTSHLDDVETSRKNDVAHFPKQKRDLNTEPETNKELRIINVMIYLMNNIFLSDFI